MINYFFECFWFSQEFVSDEMLTTFSFVLGGGPGRLYDESGLERMCLACVQTSSEKNRERIFF